MLYWTVCRQMDHSEQNSSLPCISHTVYACFLVVLFITTYSFTEAHFYDTLVKKETQTNEETSQEKCKTMKAVENVV